MVVSSTRTAVPGSDGVRLSLIRRSGDPSLPTVLMVHGLASNARLWDGVAERLSGLGYPVAAVDQRGHGESQRVDHGYDKATVADDLAAVLRQVALAPAIVAGQSWGGNVVLELAARHPSLVRGALLVDGGFIRLADRFASWEQARQILAPPDFGGVTFDQLQDRFRSLFSDFPPSGVHGQLANFETLDDGMVRPRLSRENHMRILRHLFEHDPLARASNLTMPVWVLAVEHGNDERPEVGRFVEALPDGRMVWAKGHHDIHAQKPDLVVDLLAELTAETEPVS